MEWVERPHTSGSTLAFRWSSPTREHRMEVCLHQDACYFLAFVSLNLDLAILHRPTRATDLLHLLCQLLLFWEPNANEALHHRHRLSAATCRLPYDIHTATVFVCPTS